MIPAAQCDRRFRSWKQSKRINKTWVNTYRFRYLNSKSNMSSYYSLQRSLNQERKHLTLVLLNSLKQKTRKVLLLQQRAGEGICVQYNFGSQSVFTWQSVTSKAHLKHRIHFSLTEITVQIRHLFSQLVWNCASSTWNYIQKQWASTLLPLLRLYRL